MTETQKLKWKSSMKNLVNLKNDPVLLTVILFTLGLVTFFILIPLFNILIESLTSGEGLGLKKVLIVIDGRNENLELSARNVPGVKVLRAEGLNVYDVLKYENLVLLAPTVKSIEGRLLS